MSFGAGLFEFIPALAQAGLEGYQIKESQDKDKKQSAEKQEAQEELKSAQAYKAKADALNAPPKIKADNLKYAQQRLDKAIAMASSAGIEIPKDTSSKDGGKKEKPKSAWQSIPSWAKYSALGVGGLLTVALVVRLVRR